MERVSRRRRLKVGSLDYGCPESAQQPHHHLLEVGPFPRLWTGGAPFAWLLDADASRAPLTSGLLATDPLFPSESANAFSGFQFVAWLQRRCIEGFGEANGPFGEHRFGGPDRDFTMHDDSQANTAAPSTLAGMAFDGRDDPLASRL